MAEEQPFSQLIVVGASSGGVDALLTLVDTLPRDLPAPIVVAQHLDPSRVSQLREILAPRSTLPVRTAADRERLEPGVVYVVPANRHVEVTDDEIVLYDHTVERPMPSVDRLLSTAADERGVPCDVRARWAGTWLRDRLRAAR